MGEIACPHDRFFKALMDQPGVAGALLRERLPRSISGLLAPDAPERVGGSFIDAELLERQTDRLFRVKTIDGRPAYIYCLLEHKSAPDGRVALQLLRYLARAWTQLDKGEGLLPPVLPLVVYHGSEKWAAPPTFGGLLDADEAMRSLLLDFKYELLDIGPIDDAHLSSHRTLRAGLAVLKYARRAGQQREALESLLRLLDGVPKDFRRTAFIYIIVVYARVDRATLREAVRRAIPKREDEMVSIALQEWQAEWKAEGIAEGRADDLLRILTRRFGRVPEARRRAIRQAPLPTLDAWLDRSIDAPSLTSVFAVEDGCSPVTGRKRRQSSSVNRPSRMNSRAAGRRPRRRPSRRSRGRDQGSR